MVYDNKNGFNNLNFFTYSVYSRDKSSFNKTYTDPLLILCAFDNSV